MRKLFPVALACALALAPACGAETLPADSGILNVRDYGAAGDGRHDDTAAILRAIAASGGDTGTTFWQDRVVYLPNGTYLVSAPLLKRYADGRFGSGLFLVGQSQAGTVIRLADHAPGYGDPARPRAVVFTSSKLLAGTPTGGGKDYTRLGEGNDAYMNFVEDLTIEIGAGDPGAIGIDYLANNTAAIRNVTLRAATGSGAVGLSLTRKWPGPAFIDHLTVEGFAIGLSAAQTEYGVTFDHLRLTGQRETALRNDQNVLSIRDLEIKGPAPAIVNAGEKGFLAIDGGTLQVTEGGGRTAIANAGFIALRGVHIVGASPGDGLPQSGALTGVLGRDGHWTQASVPAWLPKPAEPPAPPSVKAEAWANAAKFGALAEPGRDAAEGLRRAFASGAAVVYLPHGTYALGSAVEIPPTLRRLVGMNSTIKVLLPRNPRLSRADGLLRILSGGPSLSIENLAIDNSNLGQQVGIEVAGPREVSIRDVVSAGVAVLDRKAGGGRVFLDDSCCGTMTIAGPQPVIARQFDTEGGGVRIVNRGAPLSILGLKTEGVSTILDNRDGARADIFGGLVYMVHDDKGTTLPAFRNAGSRLAAAFAEESLRSQSHYNVYLAQPSAGGVTNVRPDRFPARGLGRVVPDLVAGPEGQSPQ